MRTTHRRSPGRWRWRVLGALLLLALGGCAAIDEDLDLESRLAERGFRSPVVEPDGSAGGAGLLKVTVTVDPSQGNLEQRLAEASRLAWTTYDYRFDELQLTARGTSATRRTLSKQALEAVHGPRPPQLGDRSLAAEEGRLATLLGVALLALVTLVAVAAWLLVLFLRRPGRARAGRPWRPQPSFVAPRPPPAALAGVTPPGQTARLGPPPRPAIDAATATLLRRYRLRATLILALGPVLLIAAAVIASMGASRADRLLASGRHTPGTVVEIREGNPTGRISGPRQIVVRYDVDGSPRQAAVNLDDVGPGYRLGQQVDVVYDPEHPSRVRTSEEPNDPFWLVLVFSFAFVGVPLAIGVGAFRLVRARRWRRRLEENPHAVMPLLRDRQR